MALFLLPQHPNGTKAVTFWQDIRPREYTALAVKRYCHGFSVLGMTYESPDLMEFAD